MADPGSILEAAGALAEAVKKIDELVTYLHENYGDGRRTKDANYYSNWLDIAKAALVGIEEEYVGILIEAASCELNEPAQCKHLRDRINTYLYQDTLRGRLVEAIAHLRGAREDFLKGHLSDLLIFSRTTIERRRTALQEYDQHLSDLESYREDLGGNRTPAFAVSKLDEITAILNDSIATSELAGKANTLLMEADKSTLLAMTARCGRLVEALRLAFRAK
jgi:hypothetical protein